MKATNYNQPAPAPVAGFKTFEDLETYKLARDFRKAMYGVTSSAYDLSESGLDELLAEAPQPCSTL